MAFHFEFRPYRAAFRQAVLTAHGIWTEREGIVLRLTDSSGRAAYAEIAPLPGWGTETFEEAAAWCAGLPVEIDPIQARAVPDTLPCCQFAFETACDALVHAGAPSPVRSFPVAALLPAGPAVLEAVRDAAARGYTCMKWKVGVAPSAEELVLLPRVLERLPAGATLRLDANGAWDLPTARSWLEACEGKPVEFIEQPFPPGQEEPLFILAREFSTRIALDESTARHRDLLRWLEFGWPGVYVIKPSLAGSPSRLIRLLEAYEAEAVFSSAFETAAGLRSALQFAARAAPDNRALGFGTIGCFADEALNLPDPGPSLSTKWLSRLPTEALWDHLSGARRAA